jgi:hypothetical protein
LFFKNFFSSDSAPYLSQRKVARIAQILLLIFLNQAARDQSAQQSHTIVYLPLFEPFKR